MANETATGVDEQTFEQSADRELRALERALGAVEDIEVDLESGILSIEFGDGTKYIVNSHRAARQIWMAADHSAWHFDPAAVADGHRWTASKTGDELWSALGSAVGRKLGRQTSLR